ncbi:MAG: OmpA family protein [Alphaproteobacteria bacterium]|nr:OmpA family protein [Alphaproteobacteria bacterium]
MSDMGKFCVRLAVIGMVAVGASACSSVPDWVDPTTWVGGSSGPPPEVAENSAGETPDLASIPDRPEPSSTPAQRRQVADALASDRADAKYSADALRAGTEPITAEPPPPAPPQEKVAENAPPPAATPAPAAQTEPATPAAANADINANTGEVSAPAPPAEPAQQTTRIAAAVPRPAPASSGSAEPQTAMPTSSQISPSDAALGFKPSSAPPLDATVAQFVPQPILSRFKQTSPEPTAIDRRIAEVAAPAPKHHASKAMGGPEMSGSVVANLESLQNLPANTTPSVYANAQGLPPTAVVFFPGDGTLLNAEARERVRTAVAEFKQRGGTGYIRIVGHASSRTSNMPIEKHLEVIFDKSQDRADAVAKEIIKQGVPANRVLVEAVGDSQPVYYESMPKGEDGNRRAEIFLQS